jgi:hypothetical protein
LDGGSARRKAAIRTHRTVQTQNESTQKSMSQVGFEPTIQVFEQAKTVHALDCADTVIAQVFIRRWKIQTHLGLFSASLPTHYVTYPGS